MCRRKRAKQRARFSLEIGEICQSVEVSYTGVVDTKQDIHVCIRTWKRSYKVPLQHWFEVGVNVAMLVVAHSGDQPLDKLHLVGLRPMVKQGDAVFLLLLIVPF